MIIIIRRWVMRSVTDKSIGFLTPQTWVYLVSRSRVNKCCAATVGRPIRIYDFCWCCFLIQSNCILYRAITRNHATWGWWWYDGITLLHVVHTITSCLLPVPNIHRITSAINSIYFVNWMIRAIYFVRSGCCFCCIQVFSVCWRAVVAALYATNHVNLSHGM